MLCVCVMLLYVLFGAKSNRTDARGTVSLSSFAFATNMYCCFVYSYVGLLHLCYQLISCLISSFCWYCLMVVLWPYVVVLDLPAVRAPVGRRRVLVRLQAPVAGRHLSCRRQERVRMHIFLSGGVMRPPAAPGRRRTWAGGLRALLFDRQARRENPLINWESSSQLRILESCLCLRNWESSSQRGGLLATTLRAAWVMPASFWIPSLRIRQIRNAH